MIFVQSTHVGIGNIVVLEQHCFQFGGSDLEAIDLEDFFCAVDDPEPTFFVIDCYIAGLEEAVAVE